MKYTIIYLSLLAMTSISCNCFQEESTETKDSLKIDSVKIDTVKVDTQEVDSRSEVIDTLKKKNVKSQFTSKCVAYRNWKIS